MFADSCINYPPLEQVTLRIKNAIVVAVKINLNLSQHLKFRSHNSVCDLPLFLRVLSLEKGLLMQIYEIKGQWR